MCCSLGDFIVCAACWRVFHGDMLTPLLFPVYLYYHTGAEVFRKKTEYLKQFFHLKSQVLSDGRKRDFVYLDEVAFHTTMFCEVRG